MKKIPTLFERIYANHEVIGIYDNITNGCEKAFLNGTATVKYDGSCCAIIDGFLYKRFDAKKGRKIPDNAIPCQSGPDPITGHFPHWVKCDMKNKADKWFIEAEYMTCMYSNQGLKLKDGTYEAIGKHFNGNPYHEDIDYLIPHGVNEIEVERTFEGVRKYLKDNYIEGIVFWYNGKPICKIKRSDFGYDWNKK